MRVGPALPAVIGMRARADSQIRLAAPVFQVMPRAEAGQAPARDFIMLVALGRQTRAATLVEGSHGGVIGQRGGAGGGFPREYLPAPAAAFVNPPPGDRGRL